MYGGYRVPTVVEYNRQKALDYAHKWAYGRNPAYYDFEMLGGDCTNFASQVLFAGSGVMNYTPVYGWYYINLNNRTPSWTGVNFFYEFLVNNRGVGPFAEKVEMKDIKPGDFIQLSFQGGNHFNHTPIVVQTGNPVTYDNILVATHTDNQDYYPLTGFSWADIRFLHIIGVRK